MKKIFLLLILLTLVGCASKNKIDVDLTPYFIIEVNDMGEFITPFKTLSVSELVTMLPSLIVDSGKKKVLVGYTSNPKIKDLLEVNEAIKELSLSLYFVNAQNEIKQLSFLANP